MSRTEGQTVAPAPVCRSEHHPSQHLKRHVIVVVVVVVVDVAIVEIDIGVATGRRRRGPIIVVDPTRRRIAFSLLRGTACPHPTFGEWPPKALPRRLLSYGARPAGLPTRRGERQQHSLRPLLWAAVTTHPMRRERCPLGRARGTLQCHGLCLSARHLTRPPLARRARGRPQGRPNT